jgi:hypothetical protein
MLVLSGLTHFWLLLSEFTPFIMVLYSSWLSMVYLAMVVASSVTVVCLPWMFLTPALSSIPVLRLRKKGELPSKADISFSHILLSTLPGCLEAVGRGCIIPWDGLLVSRGFMIMKELIGV